MAILAEVGGLVMLGGKCQRRPVVAGDRSTADQVLPRRVVEADGQRVEHVVGHAGARAVVVEGRGLVDVVGLPERDLDAGTGVRVELARAPGVPRARVLVRGEAVLPGRSGLRVPD